MRLTIARKDDPDGFASYSMDLVPPGATIGRWAGNSLVLSDPSGRLCKIQAALRVRESACSLRNLSSMSRVCVNGAALACEQDVPVQPGDEILIGEYRLRLLPAGAVQAGAPPAQEAAVAPAAPDVFADLMGPGTLPVGAPPDMGAPHPFDMDSAAPRNHPDPLSMLAPDEAGLPQAQGGDPLALFGHAPGEPTPHLLSDPTPTTLAPAASVRELVGAGDGDAPAMTRQARTPRP